MLQGIKITKRFGGLIALSNIDFEVEKGSIVGLIVGYATQKFGRVRSPVQG